MQISRSDHSICYVDTCPSERIVLDDNSILAFGLVNYLEIDRNQLKRISQFKKVRGLDRKIKIQRYLIEKIKERVIVPCGVIRWNYKSLSFKNGEFILYANNLIGKTESKQRKILIAEEHIKYNDLVSLAWYSLILSDFLKSAGSFAESEVKSGAIIFLDLLPGDNDQKHRNLKLINHIIHNSELIEFQNDVIQKNKVKNLGFGYGWKNRSTKELKMDFEYTICDWITNSFHSFISCKFCKMNSDKKYHTDQSQLAIFLMNEGLFKIKEP